MINSPYIITPTKGQQVNLGTVSITWRIPSPFDTEDPYVSVSSHLTYEIDYTDNYVGNNTNWYAVKKRIPYSTSSFDWVVGKMIKSNKIRIRIRTKYSLYEEFSDWSLSEEFSINVFDLIPPAIINPIPERVYSDFIIIILDETLIKNTYNQKVRYTIDFKSENLNLPWTEISKNVPVGQNIIRWDISDLTSSDDYSLRVTAKNTSSCETATDTNPDQISKSYVYNIKIRQTGIFLIDTKPPQAIIQIQNSSQVTNQVDQVVNIFAEDETSGIRDIQIRECNANVNISLGDISQFSTAESDCESIEDLIEQGTPIASLISDKSIGNSNKIHWKFKDTDDDGNKVSSIKKIEALLTDIGGNNSLQQMSKVFLSIFKNVLVNDFIIVVENRDITDFNADGTIVSTVTKTFEVVYLGTNSGQVWVLEPYPRLIYTLNEKITNLFEFNDTIYICTYDQNNDIGKIYKNNNTDAVLLYTFTDVLSEVSDMYSFNSSLYIGLINGSLWSYNGSEFSNVYAFSESINSLYSDNKYLYIGFKNSSNIYLYNGISFTSVVL